MSCECSRSDSIDRLRYRVEEHRSDFRDLYDKVERLEAELDSLRERLEQHND